MELQVGVKILLRNAEGKYLLLHRSEDKYKDVAGTWDIVGGRINPGSPLMDNLKREVDEETRLKITSQPKLVAAQDILRTPGRHVVRLTYTAETEGEPVLDAEHIEYRWLTLPELKEFKELDMYFKELLDKGVVG